MIVDGTVIRHGTNARGGWDGLEVASQDDRFRYYLERTFHQAGLDDRPAGLCLFAMLNPSDANAVKPDPTTSRCGTIARGLRFRRWAVINAVPARSPKPPVARAWLEEVTRRAGDGDPGGLLPLGRNVEAHRQALTEVAETDGLVVIAPGAHAWARPLVRQMVRAALDIAGPARLRIIRLTDDGDPGHPLYTPRETWCTAPWPEAAAYAGA